MFKRIAENLFADRRNPPLEALRAVVEPDAFLWNVLPHAARTFGLAISFLPRRMATPLAIAYLYCRMLDTYEDLLGNPEEKGAAIRELVERFETGRGQFSPPPSLVPSGTPDLRERVYLVLLERSKTIDQLYLELAPAHREAIARLIVRMGEGMLWSIEMFSRSGCLETPEQLSQYCWSVLGNPILFAEEVQRLDRGLTPQPESRRILSCQRVGEVLQLANITRDLEEDTARGVFYHPELRPQEGEAPQSSDSALAEVRNDLLLRGIRLAPCFGEFISEMPASRISLARGAALILVLTTEAYYRRAIASSGLEACSEREWFPTVRLGFRWIQCVVSRRATQRILTKQAERFRRVLDSNRTRSERPFVHRDDFDARLLLAHAASFGNRDDSLLPQPE